MKRQKHLSMGSFYVYTEIAGDVLVAGNGAYRGTIGLFYCPAGEIFFLFLLKIIGIDGGAGKFIGVLQIMDARDVNYCAVIAAARKRFKIKGNRQSIEFDEYRFLKVNILRGDVKETEKQPSVCPVGFENLRDFKH